MKKNLYIFIIIVCNFFAFLGYGMEGSITFVDPNQVDEYKKNIEESQNSLIQELTQNVIDFFIKELPEQYENDIIQVINQFLDNFINVANQYGIPFLLPQKEINNKNVNYINQYNANFDLLEKIIKKEKRSSQLISFVFTKMMQTTKNIKDQEDQKKLNRILHFSNKKKQTKIEIIPYTYDISSPQTRLINFFISNIDSVYSGLEFLKKNLEKYSRHTKRIKIDNSQEILSLIVKKFDLLSESLFIDSAKNIQNSKEVIDLLNIYIDSRRYIEFINENLNIKTSTIYKTDKNWPIAIINNIKKLLKLDLRSFVFFNKALNNLHVEEDRAAINSLFEDFIKEKRNREKIDNNINKLSNQGVLAIISLDISYFIFNSNTDKKVDADKDSLLYNAGQFITWLQKEINSAIPLEKLKDRFNKLLDQYAASNDIQVNEYLIKDMKNFKRKEVFENHDLKHLIAENKNLSDTDKDALIGSLKLSVSAFKPPVSRNYFYELFFKLKERTTSHIKNFQKSYLGLAGISALFFFYKIFQRLYPQKNKPNS